MEKTDSVPEVLVELTIPKPLHDEIKDQAAKSNRTTTSVLRERLFRTDNSTKPLLINDQARQQLERMLAKNFDNADQLVSTVARAVTVKLDGFEIQLDPKLLSRLQSRCIGEEFTKFLRRTITRSLEEFVGLR